MKTHVFLNTSTNYPHLATSCRKPPIVSRLFNFRARCQLKERRLCHTQREPFRQTTGRLLRASSPATRVPLKGLDFPFKLNPACPSAVVCDTPFGWMVVDQRKISSVLPQLCCTNGRPTAKHCMTKNKTSLIFYMIKVYYYYY